MSGVRCQVAGGRCNFFFFTKQRFLVKGLLSTGLIPSRKRSRVRVTIEGQHVLLQISLQIKMFDFLLYIFQVIKQHLGMSSTAGLSCNRLANISSIATSLFLVLK